MIILTGQYCGGHCSIWPGFGDRQLADLAGGYHDDRRQIHAREFGGDLVPAIHAGLARCCLGLDAPILIFGWHHRLTPGLGGFGWGGVGWGGVGWGGVGWGGVGWGGEGWGGVGRGGVGWGGVGWGREGQGEQ